MRVLVAFDKFKGSLTAEEACAAAAAAVRKSHPDWMVDICPLTDGGDGFARIITETAGGEWRHAAVTDPLGRPISAGFGLARLRQGFGEATSADDRSAICALVDVASASGLALLGESERDPWLASSRGTGELVKAAFDAGAKSVLLGIGGSATNDLGLGALGALGLKALDEHGSELNPIPREWTRIARFSGWPLDAARGESPLRAIRIACDVTNPLLGPRGAAASYGPQKGLKNEDVKKMDHEAARVALMLCHHFRQPESLIDAPGSGAAGGIGFGLSLAGAMLMPGFELVATYLGLEQRLDEADIVLTGEGAFDATSFAGKAAGALVSLGQKRRKAVHVFAGDITHAPDREGIEIHSINPDGLSLPESMRRAGELLREAVKRALS